MTMQFLTVGEKKTQVAGKMTLHSYLLEYFALQKLASPSNQLRCHTPLRVVNARKLLNWIFLVHNIHCEKSDYPWQSSRGRDKEG